MNIKIINENNIKILLKELNINDSLLIVINENITWFNWLWDIDLKLNVQKITCSGLRASDLLLKLKIDGNTIPIDISDNYNLREFNQVWYSGNLIDVNEN